MAGLNYIDANNWRYENYGTANYLSVSGTTLTDLPESKSATGSAFYQTNQQKAFNIPATDEIWIKFNVYFDGSQCWRAYNGGSAGNCGLFSYTVANTLRFWANGTTSTDFASVIKTNQLQTVLLHMVSGNSAGIIEAWVDGEFIYTYTGDVNHGSNFADFYLQSDGSGTFFSNVIISNIQIGLDENVAELIPIYDIAIKPEIYISWIPIGKIGLKPQIYATYIPAPEKASADLLRKVANSESSNADSLRKVGQSENISADTLRKVTDSEKGIADTKRKLFAEEKISGDTFRRVVHSGAVPADTLRTVKKTEKVIADTSRKIGLITANADLQRTVKVSEKNIADTKRTVGNGENISADTYLRITCDETATADTFRQVKASTVARADTSRVAGIHEIISADICRTLANSESTAADTFRQTALSEKVSADLLRGLHEFATADTCRKVTRTERAVARTVIRIPHILNYAVKNQSRVLNTSKGKRFLADNAASLVNTFTDYGITSVSITLSEKTLSDDFSFDTAQPMEINDAVTGNLLDYQFNFLVEETTQRELVQTVKGRYSIDDQLYTWFYLETPKLIVPNGETIEVPGGYIAKRIDNIGTKAYIFIYPKAADIIEKVANYMGLTADVKIDDFTPSNLEGDEMITYADLLNSVFGWTSRLPQRQVNIFVRGGVLHCIQRGKEDSVFDITELDYSRPTINKKFNRVLCHNPNKGSSDDDDDDTPKYFSGTIYYLSQYYYLAYTYARGLLIRTENSIRFENLQETSITTYDYISLGSDEYYLSKKNTSTTATKIEDSERSKTETIITTTYNYKDIGDEIYLFLENEESTAREYEPAQTIGGWQVSSEEKHLRSTRHVPIGNGWYAQTVYLDGEPQGANLSQGAPGNRVSPYTVKQIQHTFVRESIIADNNDDTDELSAIVDDSFPVREKNMIKNELNDALRWLHRKIQETVTLDLTSKVIKGVPEVNHIVDFSERIKLDGAEYFLVSNHITFTPRQLIQQLTLIRWY